MSEWVCKFGNAGELTGADDSFLFEWRLILDLQRNAYLTIDYP